MFQDSKTDESVMIEHLIDKPVNRAIELWLNDVSVTTNLNPRISQEWVTLGGARALKVVNRSPDSKESENLYVLHGAKTFAVRTGRSSHSSQLYQRILSTFKFTN
jgi:hypothetical protein